MPLLLRPFRFCIVLAFAVTSACHSSELPLGASSSSSAAATSNSSGTDHSFPASELFLVPAQIVAIRHCEKPADLSDPNCSDKGFQRANALVNYFSNNPSIGQPDGLMCMAKKNPVKSVRGTQTCQPLSDATGVPINGYGARHWQDALDNALTNPSFDGGTVLFVWHHTEIEDIAQALNCPNAPPKWGKSFSDTWIFNMNPDGTANTFTQQGQDLFPGDSSGTSDPIPCTGAIPSSTTQATGSVAAD